MNRMPQTEARNGCVALLWMRIGPYHMARLRATAEALAGDGRVLHGIEAAAMDLYDWTPATGSSAGFERHCLFPGRHYDDIQAADLRRAVPTLLDRLQPAAVGINGWSVPEALAALRWCRRNGRQAVLFSESLPDARPAFWKEWIKRRIVRRFDAALVGGRPHREYVVRLGLKPDSVQLGYDAVDNDHFARGAARARATRRNEPSFLVNCRLIDRKNVDGVLRGYAAYRARVDVPWRLRISGSGESETKLNKLAMALGVAKTVDWLGFLQYEELPASYGIADTFVHAAHSEPWGLVLNEACAAGLPLLVSRTTGAASELLQAGVNGFTFDPESDEAICDAMVRMHELPLDRRQGMGEASRRIVGDWGPERFASGFCAALKNDRNGTPVLRDCGRV